MNHLYGVIIFFTGLLLKTFLKKVKPQVKLSKSDALLSKHDTDGEEDNVTLPIDSLEDMISVSNASSISSSSGFQDDHDRKTMSKNELSHPIAINEVI